VPRPSRRPWPLLPPHHAPPPFLAPYHVPWFNST